MTILINLCLIWAVLLPTIWLFLIGTLLVDPENNWLVKEL